MSDEYAGEVEGADGEEPPPVVPAEPPGYSGRLGEFPLPDERHYFSIPEPSPFAHSGDVPGEEVWVKQIQAVVGDAQTGFYDGETVSAVEAWREVHGAEEGEYVDAALWKRMDETAPTEEAP
jgi:hypothetical protein